MCLRSGVCLWKGVLVVIYKVGGKRGREVEKEVLVGRVVVRIKKEN